MTRPRWWLRLQTLWRLLLHRREVEDDLDAEVRSYYEIVADRAISTGRPVAEARREARLGAEGPEQVKERVRDTRTGARLDAVWRDALHALRVLRRQPLFSGVAILTLALGIGATTAVFAVVYGVMLRPLPYRDPSRLVVLFYGHQGETSPWFSPLDFRDYVTHNDAFRGTAAIAPITVNMTGSGDPERLQGAKVSWNYFDVLGVPMAEGRGFTEADDRGDGHRIVLSHGLWLRRFGGRPDVIDSTMTIDGHAVTIVGVASAALNFPSAAEFWQPLVFTPHDLAPESRGAQWVQVLARLQSGVSPRQATTALESIGRNLAREFPASETDATLLAVPLQERIVGDHRTTLFALFGAVALVLLIACANVAGLMLARAQARGREVAIRVALGASRRQLIAQLMTESLVLGMLGAAAGVGVAELLVRALVLLGPASIPRLAALSVDANVLAFALGAALVASVVFGLTPALSASGGSGLRSVAPGGLGSRGVAGTTSTRARRLLVVSELAFAAMLLFGSGLLIRSYRQLLRVEPGFATEGVATFDLSLPEAKYPGSANLDSFVSTLLARLRSEPGVESAAVAVGLPFATNLDFITGFRRADQPEPDSAAMPSASMRIVSADYFKTMKIPLRSGRLFDPRDTATAPEVVLINERTAQRYFAGLDPIGQQILVGAQLARQARRGPRTVVGIVGNVKYGGLDEDTPAEIYVPYDQQQVDAFAVVVRTTADPIDMLPPLRRDVAAIDPLLPLANAKSLAALVDASIVERRFTMVVFLAFAVVAAALAVIGIYGVLAYLVGQRRTEIGVRLAIGASPSAVVWLFIREGMVLTAVGLAAGLVAAVAAGHWLRSLLFGVTPADPATLAGAACALTAAALLATYIPARRAASVDPTDALRAD